MGCGVGAQRGNKAKQLTPISLDPGDDDLLALASSQSVNLPVSGDADLWSAWRTARRPLCLPEPS